jgi:hypothetical protein
MAEFSRHPRGVLQQNGLAEPGGRLEEDDGAVAAIKPVDGGYERFHLPLALDQRRLRTGGAP